MATKDCNSLRTNYKDIGNCDLPDGKKGLMQTYAAAQHVEGRGASVCYGARVLDERGLERVYTEGYDNPSKAVKWLRIALGLGMVALVLSQLL